MDHDRPHPLSRWVRGDPPVQHPVDKYQRFGFLAACLIGAASFTSGALGLLTLAGLILASIGVMMFTNHQGLLDRMREREERSWGFRVTEQRQATKFGAVLMLIIGLGWFAMGAVDLL